MSSVTNRIMSAVLVTAVAVTARATSSSGDGSEGAQPSAAAVPTCDSAEHRQFDFWIGDWEVTTPDGRVAGRNSITRDLDGCVIHERWAGRGGVRGESLNMWDRDRNRWHQTWVSSRGDLLVLEGALQNGSMRLTGDSGAPARPTTNRITWTPARDGSVRQLWEVSSDRGNKWQTAFDGTYRRIESAAPVEDHARHAAVAATLAYRDAWLANDAARVMATLAPDAVLLPSGMRPIAGDQAIRSFWFPAAGPSTTVTAMDQTVTDVVRSGDVAVVTGRGSLTFHLGRPEESRTQHSWFVNVVARQPDGRWLIARRMWSDLRQ